MSGTKRGLLRESAREVIVVVLSILIAFGLDAGWDASVERRQERALLSSLLEEFRANLPQLELRISNHQRLEAGNSALAGLLRAASEPVITVPDTLLLALLINPTFDPTLGTLDEAQSAGRTSLIRNPELRRSLSSWIGRWRDVREEELSARTLVQREFYPTIGRQVSLEHLMDQGGSWVLGSPSAALRQGSTAIPVTPGLLNYAGGRAQLSGRAAIELTELRATLVEIVTLLEGELGEGS